MELLPQLLQCPPLLQNLLHLLIQPLLLLLDLLEEGGGGGEGTQLLPRGWTGLHPGSEGENASLVTLRAAGAPGDSGPRRPHLLLLQADHGAVAAAAPLSLERRDLFRLDLQDLLLLLVPPLQLLRTRQASSSAAGPWGAGSLQELPVLPKAPLELGSPPRISRGPAAARAARRLRTARLPSLTVPSAPLLFRSNTLREPKQPAEEVTLPEVGAPEMRLLAAPAPPPPPDLDAVLPLVHLRLQAPLLLGLLAKPLLQLPLLLSHELHVPLELLQPLLALGRQRRQPLRRLLLLPQHLHRHSIRWAATTPDPQPAGQDQRASNG